MDREEKNIDALLTKLDKKQLINIIKEQIMEDPNLEDIILLRYSSENDAENELKKCKKYINLVAKKYFWKDYLDDDDIFSLTNDLRQLLYKVKNVKNKILGIDILLVLLEKSIDFIRYTECSDEGYILDSFIEDIIFTIQEIALSVENPKIRDQIFERLLEECDKEVLDRWYTFQMDIINVCCKIANTIKQKETLRYRIEDIINIKDVCDYSTYDEQTLKKYLYNLIVDYADEDDIQKFIENNIKYPAFRHIAIEKCFDKNNFEMAIDYAKEGEILEAGFRYKVIGWKKIRYKAYEKLGLIEEQKALAKELVFYGEIDYYKILKDLCGEEDFYKNFKHNMNELKKKNLNMYLNIADIENDFEAIIECVKENNYYIKEYAEKLIPKYRVEVMCIYESYLKERAKYMSKRTEYRALCNMISDYKNIVGDSAAQRVINDLRMTYKRKRAFLDELDQIK